MQKSSCVHPQEYLLMSQSNAIDPGHLLGPNNIPVKNDTRNKNQNFAMGCNTEMKRAKEVKPHRL